MTATTSVAVADTVAIGSQSCRTLVEVLAARAVAQPEHTVFGYLEPDGSRETLGYRDLLADARRIASRLRQIARPRQRVMLLLPPGLLFPRALFGALGAGLIAVPAALPDPRRLARTLPRLLAILDDAGPAAVLTSDAGADGLRAALAGRRQRGDAMPEILTLDDLASWTDDGQGLTAPEPESLAFLQYTSGSTAAPKGVMISHRSLMAGAHYLQSAWRYDEDSRALIWVPDFHDDGLLQGNFLPVFAGYTCWRMAPADLVRRPARWLRAVSDLGITHSGGPDFAYALCLRKAWDEDLDGVDLSSWRLAYNAAEPVRAHTIEQFIERFASLGFRAETMCPAFGLAEATLLVTSSRLDEAPRTLRLDPDALERDGRVVPVANGRPIVSCGPPVDDIELRIVDPETLEDVDGGHVGEVWIGARSLADGYWNLPETTECTFVTVLRQGAERRYLRTGDLGFADSGSGQRRELFITGRIKDLIIIRGRNLYPQDIELTAESSHPALRAGCGAAFAVESDTAASDGGEQLVVVFEIAESSTPSERRLIADRVSEAIVEAHDVRPAEVVLIGPRTIAKTSSGKIQRQTCRRAYLDDSLERVETEVVDVPGAGSERSSAHADERIEWMRRWHKTLDLDTMDERRTMPAQVLMDLGARGFFALVTATRYGGLGLRWPDALRLVEQLGAIDIGLASTVLGQSLLGSHTIERSADEAQRQALLPDLASGRALSAFALSEAGSASNPRAIEARGRYDASRRLWVVDGDKRWVGAAAWATHLLIFVDLDSGPGGTGGPTALLVERHQPGVVIGPEELTFGVRSMVQNRVELRAVEISEDRRLGPIGSGMEVALGAVGHTRLGLAAMSVGVMKRCSRELVRFAESRQIATGRLLDHPVVIERLSALTATITALDSLVEQQAIALDSGQGLASEAAMVCKIVAAEGALEAADGLMQTLGARGYMEPSGVPRLLRDARLLSIYEGTTETLLAHLGSVLAQDPERARELVADGALGEQMDDLRQQLTALSERISSLDDTARRHWLHQQLGRVMCLQVLRAAVAECAPRPELERSGLHLSATLERLVRDAEATAQGGELVTVPTLVEEIEGYDVTSAEPDLEPRAKAELPAELLAAVPESPSTRSTDGDLTRFVVERVAEQLGREPDSIDIAATFATLGLDSVSSVMLVDDLETEFALSLDPGLIWEHPTIERLVSHLACLQGRIDKE